VSGLYRHTVDAAVADDVDIDDDDFRFWLLDCQQVGESTRLSSELYRDVIAVPFISQVVVFAKRRSMIEAHLRIYCVTDDRLDKTLETREHYREVARSRGIEVLLNSALVSHHSDVVT